MRPIFLNRVGPDETEARALIRCGALDALGRQGGRAGLMWTLACWQSRCEPAAGARRAVRGADRKAPARIAG